ncbi:hypothetical protein MRX96_049814 [Rhipicephalus microplus]
MFLCAGHTFTATADEVTRMLPPQLVHRGGDSRGGSSEPSWPLNVCIANEPLSFAQRVRGERRGAVTQLLRREQLAHLVVHHAAAAEACSFTLSGYCHVVAATTRVARRVHRDGGEASITRPPASSLRPAGLQLLLEWRPLRQESVILRHHHPEVDAAGRRPTRRLSHWLASERCGPSPSSKRSGHNSESGRLPRLLSARRRVHMY